MLHSKTPMVGVPAICGRCSAWSAFQPKRSFEFGCTIAEEHSYNYIRVLYGNVCLAQNVFEFVFCVFCILQASKRIGNLYTTGFDLYSSSSDLSAHCLK